MLNKSSKTKGILAGALLLAAAAAAIAAPKDDDLPNGILPGRRPLKDAKKPPADPPAGAGNGNGQQSGGPRPKVEVVFVLDTTGSMSGLLQGAKDKIWGIANHIASGNPRPDLRVGLVAYRDITDDYVTKDFALTSDLDAVYAKLKSFQAQGGGDTPEHVSKGLYDAVNNMQWSDGAMKMIFLVGDAPPHMDYHDGFDYHQIVKQANKKEIAIYSIRCGGDPETERVWKEIASAGHGVYASIAQDGAVAVVATPMDPELAELGHKLDGTTVVYGGGADRARVAAKQAVAATAPAPAAADRGGYYAKSGARLDDADLIAQAEAGEISVDKLEKEKLPEPMQKMNKDEQKAYIAAKQTEREAIMKRMGDLSAQRDAYLREEAKKSGAAGKKDGFDNVVTKAITEQGAAYHIAF